MSTSSTNRITACSVLWNEAARLPKLLETLQPTFRRTLVIVQESEDETWQIARSYQRDSDLVVADIHHGTGDASMPLLKELVETDWTFVISGDELPDEELLSTIGDAVDAAEAMGADGVWIRFRSFIDGFDFSGEQDAHLRLYRSSLDWPGSMHSRPDPKKNAHWDKGAIYHERSLDEMMLDYLRYYELSGDNESWLAHNRLMMHDACAAVAGKKGWDYVTAFPWWPRVASVAFPS